MKYLKIIHTDFWICHHDIDRENFEKTVDVFVCDDKEGEVCFINFDIGTPHDLKIMIDSFLEDYHESGQEGDLEEANRLTAYYEKLKSGEIYCFIRSLFYDAKKPSLSKLNSVIGTDKTINDISPSSATPYFGILFVSENYVNSMDDLIRTLKKLFVELKLGEHEFEFINVKSKEETQKSYDDIVNMYM